MRTPPFQLTEALRLRARADGESGARWIDGLGEQVASLERDWDIHASDSLAGGSESLVLDVMRADGTPAILKLGLPGTSDLTHEANVYHIADGRGYAKLLAHDAERNALLLERLGRAVGDLGLPVRTQLELICATLPHAWVSLGGAAGLMTGAAKARWLADFIARTFSALEGPCSRATIDRALAFAEDRERAHAPSNCVLVHGDCHEHNTLLLPGIGGHRCKFVDPDGLFAEPAYDLGILMRGFDDALLAGDVLQLGRARCAWLSGRTGVDETAIWQWGYIERVSTGLLMTQLGMPDGRDTLAIAERWSLS